MRENSKTGDFQGVFENVGSNDSKAGLCKCQAVNLLD
jgi:hypothetical protein